MAQAIASIAVLVETLRQHQLLGGAELSELAAFQRRCSDPRDLAREILRRNWLTPFQVNQLLQGNVADLLVGPYLVLERLDEGGQGQVFKAKHRHMERVVALKVLHKAALDDPEILGRFQRESKVISQLDHPNIVHAHDAGPVGANFFLAMEFIEGVNLWQVVRKQGALQPGVAADYIRQAALGLQHIHERGLVHRDIKPSNLVLTRISANGAGIIKILDLGLARRMQPIHGESTEKLTTDGSGALGTVDYMAPEQALDFHKADIRADIYSLGHTFYYLLTGIPPFGNATVAQKLIWHQHREPTPVEQCVKGVPLPLLQNLKRMTAKNPAERFQTPGEVARALAGHAVTSNLKPKSAPIAVIVPDSTERIMPGNGSVHAGPAVATTPLPVGAAASGRRRKIAFIAAAVGGLACLVLFAVMVVGALRKKEPPLPVVRENPGKKPPVTVPPDLKPPDKPPPDQPNTGVPLLAIERGQLPNDSGSNARFFSIEDHPSIGKVLKVDFPSGDSFGDRVPLHLSDWSTCTGLWFDVWNLDKETYVLHLNVLHRRSTNYQTRIDAPFHVKPGRTRVKIPIPPMVNTNGTPPDLAGIVKWYILVEGGKGPTLYFSSFWLDGGDVVIQGKPNVRDVVVDSQQPTTALGGERKSAIKKNDFTSALLVQFNVERFLPQLQGRVVERVTVSFYVWDPSSQGKTVVRAYPITAPWDEATATWHHAAAGRLWRGRASRLTEPHSGFQIGVDTGNFTLGAAIIPPDPPGADVVEPPFEYQLDVTDIARAWLEKKHENHGLAIAPFADKEVDQNFQTRFQIFMSEYERPQYSPKLHFRMKR